VNRWPLYISLLAPLAACGNPPTETADEITQTYLFEVEHVNHAWGMQWHGLVIDREGNINAYDHSNELWSPVEDDSYSETELQDKYEHVSRYVGRIDEATVVHQFNRIAGVPDQLSEPQYPCRDAGGLTYRAFRYETATGRYLPLLLRQEGDVVRENTSDEAEELAAWLRNLVSALDNAGIAPFNEGVCTP
jgi:hypothetical protein